jgi:large subunit ribosomal protein L4
MPSAAKKPQAAKPQATKPQATKREHAAPILAGTGTVKLDSAAFGAEFNMSIVHETVRSEQAARRRGTHATKTRGDVRGGGAKPWKQKGTGRARAGSSRNPLWTGGGVAFGPQPRHYTFKVNRKARRVALRSALSVHAERGSIAVFDAGAFEKPATKRAATLLFDWDPARPQVNTLVLLAESEREAGLSFRNIDRVLVLPVEDAGVANIIGAARLLVSEAALPSLVARAKGTGSEGAGSEDTATEEGEE